MNVTAIRAAQVLLTALIVLPTLGSNAQHITTSGSSTGYVLGSLLFYGGTLGAIWVLPRRWTGTSNRNNYTSVPARPILAPSLPTYISPSYSAYATPAPLAIAAFWRRVCAVACDRAIMVAMLILFLAVGQQLTNQTQDPTTGHLVTKVSDYGGILMLLGLLSAPVYFVVCDTIGKGRSIGYRLAGIRLVRLDGKKPHLGTHTLRWLGQFASLLVLGLGYFWVLWDTKKQTWHDKFAGTVVVREPCGAWE